MNRLRTLFAKATILLVAAMPSSGVLQAHPMGNFSINHYALLMPGPRSVEVLYVLDVAELPTFQMLQQWELTKDSPRSALEARAAKQSAEWVRNLVFTEDGAVVHPKLGRTDFSIQDGAGGLPVVRINMHLTLPGQPGQFRYEDRNYPERAGWKEVVIEARTGVALANAVPSGSDRSRALTAYPQDPTLAPPQDVSAHFSYTVTAPDVTKPAPTVTQAPPPPISRTDAETAAARSNPASVPPAVVTGAATPEGTPEPARGATSRATRGATPAEANSLGTVKRNDFLSRTLNGSRGTLPFGLALLCLAAAFGVGALHAVEPGHGKTMVAAYLVGSRGTFRQAIFLGGMVTFTHTISVFALGVVTLFLAKYLLPETLIRVVSVISGVSIIWIGGLLLYRRGRKLMAKRTERNHSHSHGHSHTHSHDHEHTHSDGHTHHDGHGHTHSHPHQHETQPAHAHAHAHAHPHEHSHEHGAPAHTHPHSHPHAHHHHDHGHSHALTHTHDGHTHTHVPEGDVTLGSLIALGVSGGLVPCPAALVLLLSCISIGRPAFGLVLLVAFSVGLALVLMLIGMTVLLVKNSVPKSKKPSHVEAWARYAPVFSAAIIFAIGIYMTGVAVGAFPVVRLIG